MSFHLLFQINRPIPGATHKSTGSKKTAQLRAGKKYICNILYILLLASRQTNDPH
jgi:hypothetical protein